MPFAIYAKRCGLKLNGIPIYDKQFRALDYQGVRVSRLANVGTYATKEDAQAILDKLCQLELDGVKAQLDAKNDKIADLQRENLMKDLQASQVQQTADLRFSNIDAVDSLYNRLSNCPVPSTPVYGRTPIFTCNQNPGCGCGNVYGNTLV